MHLDKIIKERRIAGKTAFIARCRYCTRGTWMAEPDLGRFCKHVLPSKHCKHCGLNEHGEPLNTGANT